MWVPKSHDGKDRDPHLRRLMAISETGDIRGNLHDIGPPLEQAISAKDIVMEIYYACRSREQSCVAPSCEAEKWDSAPPVCSGWLTTPTHHQAPHTCATVLARAVPTAECCMQEPADGKLVSACLAVQKLLTPRANVGMLWPDAGALK